MEILHESEELLLRSYYEVISRAPNPRFQSREPCLKRTSKTSSPPSSILTCWHTGKPRKKRLDGHNPHPHITPSDHPQAKKPMIYSISRALHPMIQVMLPPAKHPVCIYPGPIYSHRSNKIQIPPPGRFPVLLCQTPPFVSHLFDIYCGDEWEIKY